MHPKKRTMVWINAVGGMAVLGSYAQGLWSHPAARGAVWGGVPETLRPVYTVSMLLAAAGYLAFTYFLFHLHPDRVRVRDRFGFGVFSLLYAVVLIPSALWMPLTFAMLDHPSEALWYAIRLTLATVGVGSMGLLAALINLRPRSPVWQHRVAVAGCLAFCLQTALLDALVWTAFFPV